MYVLVLYVYAQRKNFEGQDFVKCIAIPIAFQFFVVKTSWFPKNLCIEKFASKSIMYTYPEVKLDVHVLAESARVVVPVGPGIPESLQHGVGLDQTIFHMIHLSRVSTTLSHILQHVLTGL